LAKSTNSLTSKKLKIIYKHGFPDNLFLEIEKKVNKKALNNFQFKKN